MALAGAALIYASRRRRFNRTNAYGVEQAPVLNEVIKARGRMKDASASGDSVCWFKLPQIRQVRQSC
jgi:hypothetical protein